jgi:hypothetical protein
MRFSALTGRAGGFGWWQAKPLVLALSLVWLAHIGVDRLLGYGLKYDDSFKRRCCVGRSRQAGDWSGDVAGSSSVFAGFRFPREVISVGPLVPAL